MPHNISCRSSDSAGCRPDASSALHHDAAQPAASSRRPSAISTTVHTSWRQHNDQLAGLATLEAAPRTKLPGLYTTYLEAGGE